MNAHHTCSIHVLGIPTQAHIQSHTRRVIKWIPLFGREEENSILCSSPIKDLHSNYGTAAILPSLPGLPRDQVCGCSIAGIYGRAKWRRARPHPTFLPTFLHKYICMYISILMLDALITTSTERSSDNANSNKSQTIIPIKCDVIKYSVQGPSPKINTHTITYTFD